MNYSRRNRNLVGSLLVIAASAVVAIIIVVQIKEKNELLQHWRQDQATITALRDEIYQLERQVQSSNAELSEWKAPHIKDLIVTVARMYHIEPEFMYALATVENPTFQFTAIHKNTDGSTDRGLMQLNDSWFTNDLWFDPYVNASAAAGHIAWLRSQKLSWWEVAIAYNCGRYKVNNPPQQSLDYAARVMQLWQLAEPNNVANKGGK